MGLTCVCSGGGSSDGTCWRSVQSRSTAEIREHESDRLPFLSKRALKLSLLDDLWVLKATGCVEQGTGSAEEDQEEDTIQCPFSSECLLPSIFLLDLERQRQSTRVVGLLKHSSPGCCLTYQNNTHTILLWKPRNYRVSTEHTCQHLIECSVRSFQCSEEEGNYYRKKTGSVLVG